MRNTDIENFSCSTDGKFGFKFNDIYYNCTFVGGKNVKVEYNTDTKLVSKIIECVPIEYDNYYDFCYGIATQIIAQIGDK